MEAATQKLKQDLQTVVTDAEELLKASATQTGERIEKARARAEESLRIARLRLAETTTLIGQNARAAALNVDDQARKHPWATAGIAAGVGLLLGLLIGRR
ncbi:MAG TPA: DUF883 family protein [Burkholderiales bacterium]|nr:DUF883 family protein [Burkholderiales bacterium]